MRRKEITKQEHDLLVKVFNRAIEDCRSRGGLIYNGDRVVEINFSQAQIAPFIDRHPGWVKLCVKLEEGTGEFFISSSSFVSGNKYYVAWEVDNNYMDIFRMKVLGEITLEEYRTIVSLLDDIIGTMLYTWQKL